MTDALVVILSAGVIVAAFFCGYYYKTNTSSSEYDDSVSWFLSVINEKYYQDVSTEDFYGYTFSTFVANYLDEYSAYYTAEEYAALTASNAGSKSGYGISYSYVEQRGILVTSVIYNSPAYKSGLRSGEYIVSATYGGDTTEFSSTSEFSSYAAGLDTGESVTFNTLGGDCYTMAKSSYTASYVVCATNDSSWAFLTDGEEDTTPELTKTDTDIIEALPDGAGYICLSQFYGNAASEFAQAIKVLNSQNCTSIILDLRNNGGGYVSTMQYISGCFVDSGEVVMTAKYKSGEEDSYKADGTYVSSEDCKVSDSTKVYVLANGNTASASEALIGVLYSYGIIDYSDIYLSDYSDEYISLVGGTAETLKSCRTYGKGIMQSPFTNSSTGEVLKLTTAQIYWPNGDTIHGVGITESDGAKTVSSPHPASGAGEELTNAINMIFG